MTGLEWVAAFCAALGIALGVKLFFDHIENRPLKHWRLVSVTRDDPPETYHHAWTTDIELCETAQRESQKSSPQWIWYIESKRF